MSETLELYFDVKRIIDEFPEPPGLEKQRQFRGADQQAERLRWIAELSLERYAGDIAEIGAHVGSTTIMLAELARAYERRVIVVDPWQAGTPGCHGWEYEQFLENIRPHEDIVDVVRMSSVSKEAIATLKERPLAFAYVDGLHIYRACLLDIMACAHAEGIIAVDDIYWKPDLMRAFLKASDETWRVPVLRDVMPMREGYLLPAGKEPSRVPITDVVNEVRRCVHSGRPFSVIRLGDGEARLLEWPHLTERRAPLFQSLRYWFGHQGFGSGDLNEMARQLRGAVHEADIIGVPSEQHRQERVEWARVEYYLRLYDLVSPTAVLASSDLHIELYKADLLGHLLKGLEDITIITCRDVREMLARTYGLAYIEWLAVPAEAQTCGFLPTDHWPERFRQLQSQIMVRRPGQLFLIGAGPLGKIYAAWVKQRGGVALDVGSVFDVWAGVYSRSYQKELH